MYVCVPRTKQPIRHTGDITEASLAAFEEKFFKGELTPTLKSEEPSDEDLEEPVKVVKGKSFSKMVLENGKFLRCVLSCLALVCFDCQRCCGFALIMIGFALPCLEPSRL